MLERQASQPWCEHSLLVIHPNGADLAALPQAAAWSFHAGHANAWKAAGRPAFCQATPPELSAYSGILMVIAKEKELNRYVLEQLALLAPDTPIWFAGEKRSGIQPLMKRLPAWLQPAQKVASANHCVLYSSTRNATPHQPAALELWAKDIQYELNAQTRTFVTLPGVFSREHIDPATQLLLNNLGGLPQGRMLDFACGAGVIAAHLTEQATEVMACDVSPLALAASKLTLNSQSSKVTLCLADGIPSDAGQFDAIVSNPPFHTGQKTDYHIAHQFIRDAKQHLKTSGVFQIVANRFLPWPEVIQSVFGHCDTVADDGRYRIYRAACR